MEQDNKLQVWARSLVGSNAWATCGQIREQRLGSGGRASPGN